MYLDHEVLLDEVRDRFPTARLSILESEDISFRFAYVLPNISGQNPNDRVIYYLKKFYRSGDLSMSDFTLASAQVSNVSDTIAQIKYLAVSDSSSCVGLGQIINQNINNMLRFSRYEGIELFPCNDRAEIFWKSQGYSDDPTYPGCLTFSL